MSVEITKIAVFKGRQIRRILVKDEWWFSVIDVVEVLTETERPRKYWSDLKKKLAQEGYVEVSEKIGQLKLKASDGKEYLTDCANTEILFRIIQSIPSPKAEPFKRWLARIGKERLDEIENPELGMQRTKELYEKKGYPKEWIEKRLRGIAVRQKLTDEWDGRGAETDMNYAILTNEIMQGAFELKVDDYKKHKGLKRENLRDHMTDLELIITMLGEAATTRITQDRDSTGMPALQKDAKDGGILQPSVAVLLEWSSHYKTLTSGERIGPVSNSDLN
ncbi:MAG: Bro-N domain-containing protein [Candidatus Omnitrophica bacterium]|nr:Bro-N domain-containing protein [Candidatus Omnitrophota bacterium]